MSAKKNIILVNFIAVRWIISKDSMAEFQLL